MYLHERHLRLLAQDALESAAENAREGNVTLAIKQASEAVETLQRVLSEPALTLLAREAEARLEAEDAP